MIICKQKGKVKDMKKNENVNEWFRLRESNKLEEQAKGFIADTVEGYLNGCYDCGYEPMTRESWEQYVWQTIEYEKQMYINDQETNHLKFLGKKKFMELVNFYLDNYEDVKPYII